MLGSLSAAEGERFVGSLRDVRIWDDFLSLANVSYIASGEGRVSAFESDTKQNDNCWAPSRSCIGDPAQYAAFAARSSSAGKAGAYTYSEALTPAVTSITRRNGSTAGGTTLTLRGRHFGSAPVIKLAGVTCATTRAMVSHPRHSIEDVSHA